MPAKFKVGQVVMFDRNKRSTGERSNKASIPILIVGVFESAGQFFYKIDRKNSLHEPMLRELNAKEKGEE